jgi:hypothetical protein
MFFYLLRFKASAKQTNRDDRINWYGAESKVHDPKVPADQRSDVDKPVPEMHEPEDRAPDRSVRPQAIPSSAPVQESSPRINKWLIAVAVVLIVVVLLSFYESTNA